MKLAPNAPPLRRLAPLAVAVLAVHVWLLQPEGHRTVAPAPVNFQVRAIAAPVPPPAPVPVQQPSLAAEPAAVSPPPVARPRPAAQVIAVEDRQPAAVSAQASTAAEPPAPAPPSTPAPAPAAAPAAGPASALPARPAAAPATPSQPTVVSLLPSMRIHYQVQAQVRGLSLSGQAQLAWRHDGRTYEAHMEATALGRPRVQRSVGRVTPHGLAPDTFLDKSRSERATHFDREKDRLVFSNNRPDAPLAAGMQDRLSVVLQLAAVVAGNPDRHGAGASITIPTAGPSDAEDWVFSVEGEEDLRLPGGAVRALKLVRLPRKEYDQKVELWLAPRMDYAPVRLRLTNPNGDAVDQRWSSTDRG